MKKSKSSGKRVPKGEKPLPNSFRLQATTYFLTYKGISDSGQKITKESLANFLLNKNPNDVKLVPVKYLVCEQMYDDGTPHYHAILIYPRRKEVTNPNHYDYFGIHPNVQSMRNMKAALNYVYKQDSHPVTNMDVVQQRRKARAKDGSSLYELLREQMMKDPFNFRPIEYCLNNDIDREAYGANYSKAINWIKLIQQAYCNKCLFQNPGFKPITRALVQQRLSPEQLAIYDSWSGYQVIVDHLNQVPRYRFRRPAKTMNLLITGPSSIGKSALVWQQYPEPHHNPINAHCSVYPMGMKDWFPRYQSQVYDVIFWNEAKLTSYSYDVILQLLDGNPVQLPSKGGGHKKVDNPLVLMTSNMTLQQMIQQKFGYNKKLVAMSRHNLSHRITNVIVPRDLNLFLLQKLLVPA